MCDRKHRQIKKVFSEIINKNDTPLIKYIKNKKLEPTTDLAKKYILLKDKIYYIWLYANTFKNSDKRDKLLERINKTIGRNEKSNSNLSVKWIESVIRNIPSKNSSGPDDLPNELFQIFEEEIIVKLHRLFQTVVK